MFRKPHHLLIPIKIAKINVEANYLPWSCHNPCSVTWSQCTITIKHANGRPFVSYHFCQGWAFSIWCICTHLDNDNDANRSIFWALKLLSELSFDIKIQGQNSIEKSMDFEWNKHVSVSFVSYTLLFNLSLNFPFWKSHY